jgi:DNA-binding FadR family transcriptional regulator
MRLPPRGRGAVADEAVPRIVELILEAGLRPGDRLPSERELMARLAVGRSSLREAVRTLVALGVIEVAVGSGMYVADGEGSMITRPLFWGRLMSEQSTRDVVEARRVVEVELAGLAAERARDDELAAIREKITLIERHLDDPDAFARYDLEFHLAIADAAHNQVLRQVIDTMRHVMRAWFAEAFRGREDRSEPVGRHQLIYDAIAARDPERARQAMAEHIEGGARWLFEAIERGGRGKGSQ